MTKPLPSSPLPSSPLPSSNVAAPARPVSAPAITVFLLSVTPFFLTYDRHASFAFAALTVMLSIALGITALRRVGERGQNGEPLAVAGLVISGIMVAHQAFTIALGIFTRTW